MTSVEIRTMRDFLMIYNQITDTCFTRCANSFDQRNLDTDEAKCVSNCTQKHINANNKIMQVYTEVQPVVIQRRIKEVEAEAQKFAEQQQAEQAAAAAKQEEEEQKKAETEAQT